MPIGPKYMIIPTSLRNTSASSAYAFCSVCRETPGRNSVATPRKSANTTICATLPVANASNTFDGTRPKNTSVTLGTSPSVASTSSVSCHPAPGSSRCMTVRPRVSASTVVAR